MSVRTRDVHAEVICKCFEFLHKVRHTPQPDEVRREHVGSL